jgi:hypothetical protein
MSNTKVKKAGAKKQSTRARLYVATGKKPNVELNRTLTMILTQVRKHPKGVSERQLMAGLKMPRSTVWYALLKLAKLHAVTPLKVQQKAA